MCSHPIAPKSAKKSTGLPHSGKWPVDFIFWFSQFVEFLAKTVVIFFNEPQKNPQPISILWKRAVDFSFNTTPPRCSLASAGGILHQTSEQLNHRIGSFRLQIIRQKLLNFSHKFRNHCLVAANDFIKSKAKRERPTPFPFGFFAVHLATDGFTVSIPTTQMRLPSSSRLSIYTIYSTILRNVNWQKKSTVPPHFWNRAVDFSLNTAPPRRS